MRPGASQYHELSKVRAQSLAHGVSRARKQCTRAAMRSYSLGCPTSILGKAKVFVLSELLTPARPARAPARPAMHARPRALPCTPAPCPQPPYHLGGEIPMILPISMNLRGESTARAIPLA